MGHRTTSSSDNPLFNNARGFASTLQMAPPFRFKQVTMTVFPLRANLSRLRSFCDNFLNRTQNDANGTELMRFEPFIPYVYLVILDYGQMAREAANMGWVSQREVAFSVPLAWLVPKKGAWDFHDWAYTSPFIFVDNELSMSTGREVYGWPKTLASLDADSSDWIRSPSGTRQVFSVSANVFEEAYRGHSSSMRPFLSIHHEPLPSFSTMPPDLRCLMEPLARLPNVAGQFARVGADLFRTFSGIAMEGVTGSPRFPNFLDPKFYVNQARPEQLKRWFDPTNWRPGAEDLARSMFPSSKVNTVNFKQFRDISNPWEACYQGITNAQMKLEDVSRGGLLGEPNLAIGQLDGGFRIDMHQFGNLPIVDSLGLEVSSTQNEAGVPVASLQPTFPFWMEVDMSYAKGKTLAWRSRHSHWTPGDGMAEIDGFEPLAPPSTESTAPPSTAPEPVPAPKMTPAADPGRGGSDPAVTPLGHLYSTARGAAGQAIAGPFEFPNTTVRALPLLADGAVLDAFVSNYLDVEGHARFEAWGDCVYLLAINYDGGVSKVENVGLMTSRALRFVVPVKWYAWYEDGEYDLDDPADRERRDREKLVTVAMTTPFAYADDVLVAIGNSEIDGVPTLRTRVQSPPDKWMSTRGPSPHTARPLLQTTGVVIPALGVGAGGRDATFLSITEAQCLPANDLPSWRHVARGWGPRVAADLETKYRQRGHRAKPSPAFVTARAMMLDLMSGQRGFHDVNLKQFRDAWDTDRACYQSLVLDHIAVERLHELSEIDHPIHVWITRFPTQPVGEILGLQAKHHFVGDEGIVDVYDALRPFWFSADLRTSRGLNVYERVGTQTWSVVEPERLEDLGLDPIPPPSESRRILDDPATLEDLDTQPLHDPAALVDDKFQTLARDVPVGDCRAAIGQVYPATVIDAALSRQWAVPPQQRDHTHTADFCVRAEIFGDVLGEEIFPDSERQGERWPAAGDIVASRVMERTAMAKQIREETMTCIMGADPEFRVTAIEKMPPIMRQQIEKANLPAPEDTSADAWDDIAKWMAALIEIPNADWRTIKRPLSEIQRRAAHFADALRRPALHPDEEPEKVARTLRERLTKLAEETAGQE